MNNEKVTSIKEHVSQTHTVLFVDEVQKLHDTSKGSAPRILVATDTSLAYYKATAEIVADRMFFWSDMLKFEYDENENKISFEFKNREKVISPDQKDFETKPCRFVTTKAKEFYNLMSKFFLRIFPAFRYPDIGIPVPEGKKIVFSPLASISRLKSFAETRKVVITDELLNELKNILKFRKPNHTLAQDSSEIYPYMIAALQLSPYIESLTIPSSANASPYHAYGMTPFGYIPFKHIGFDGEALTLFKKCLKTFLLKDHNKVQFYTFMNSNFEIGHIESLKEYLITRPAKGLGFENAISEDIFDYMNTEFFEAGCANSLEYLSFRNSMGLNYKSLLPHISHLSVLSFANIGIDLSEAITAIFSSGMQNLKALDLSGNKSTGKFETENIEFPPNLIRLDVNNTSFMDSSLVSFVDLVLTQGNSGMFLYIDSIQASENEINDLFNYLESVSKSTLGGISWMSNSVSEIFLDFLGKCPELTRLNLSNCFTRAHESLLIKLSQVLPQMSKLTHISIRPKNEPLAEFIYPVLSSLKTIMSLYYLDISGHNAGGQGIEMIAEIIASTSIKTIAFDNNLISTIDQINKILHAARARKTSINLSWPEHDVNDMLTKGVMKEKGYYQLITNFNAICGNPNEPIDPTDPFTKPYDVFMLDPLTEEDFPQYITESLSKQISAPPQPKKKAKKPKPIAKIEEEEDQAEIKEIIDNPLVGKYLGDDEDLSTDDPTSIKSQKPWTLLDNGFKEPEWDSIFNNTQKEFEVEPVLERLKKKYSLPYLRGSIQ